MAACNAAVAEAGLEALARAGGVVSSSKGLPVDMAEAAVAEAVGAVRSSGSPNTFFTAFCFSTAACKIQVFVRQTTIDLHCNTSVPRLCRRVYVLVVIQYMNTLCSSPTHSQLHVYKSRTLTSPHACPVGNDREKTRYALLAVCR